MREVLHFAVFPSQSQPLSQGSHPWPAWARARPGVSNLRTPETTVAVAAGVGVTVSVGATTWFRQAVHFTGNTLHTSQLLALNSYTTLSLPAGWHTRKHKTHNVAAAFLLAALFLLLLLPPVLRQLEV